MISIEYTTNTGFMVRTNLELKGRGIKKDIHDWYFVTDKAMDKLREKYECKTNF